MKDDKQSDSEIDNRIAIGNLRLKKWNNIFMILTACEFVIMGVLTLLLGRNWEYLIMCTIATIGTSLPVAGVFRYVVHTKSYWLLSGYNSKKKYDEMLLDKMLLGSEFSFLLAAFLNNNVTMFLILLNNLTEDQMKSALITCFLAYTGIAFIGMAKAIISNNAVIK